MALPPKEDFPKCWKKTVKLVKKEGIIAGHFFDYKAKVDPCMTYHSEDELRALIVKDFDIIWFKNDSSTPIYGGTNPPWGQLFHVVAKKR